MRNEARIGLIAVAMAMAIGGRGCVTAPPPDAASLVAGAEDLVHTSDLVAAGGTSPGSPTAVPDAPTASAAQRAEPRRAELHKQLNDSRGAFDARLREEQQRTAEERDARQTTVSAATMADYAAGERAVSRESASGNGAMARPIPDGSDDDIVARRIRKAAELESDPELKGKLWKEYVEYQSHSQGR